MHATEIRKEVIILRGPSGAGKSTWVQDNEPDAKVVSADGFWMIHTGHCDIERKPDRDNPVIWDTDGWYEYMFDPKHLSEAHSWCMCEFIDAVEWAAEFPSLSSVIIVDNTNIQQWMYEAYKRIAFMMGYKVRVVDFVADSLAVERACAARNTHGVPAEIVERMFDEFERDIYAEVVHIEVRLGQQANRGENQ